MATSTKFKIDNPSPLILYSAGQWNEGSLALDPQASRYFGNFTFKTTTDIGASASFDFNGTSITIGGAKRLNHGPYQVVLDGKVSNLDGGASPDIFQTALFQASGLTQGPHNIKIINQPTPTNGPFLDIDFIEWESTVQGNQFKTIQDSDPSFIYSPANAWTTDVAALPGFSSSNGHSTTTDKASAAFTFTGDAIQLMGSVGPDHGVFVATLDGNSRTLNSTHSTYQPQQMLYFADGLGAGQHTLTVVRSTGKLAIDFATIIEFNGKQPQALDVPAIAGIAVGGVVALALIFLGFFLWSRKQRRINPHIRVKPSLLIDVPAMVQSPPSLYHPPSNANYYPGSQVAVTDPYAVMPGTSSSRPGYGHAPGSSGQFYSVPAPTSIQSAPSPPGSQRLPSADWRYPNEKDPNRMYVSGREQDGGPAPIFEEQRTPRLPPDYSQATEVGGPPPRAAVEKF